jgi:galactokinase
MMTPAFDPGCIPSTARLVADEFQQRHGTKASVFFAPGRVNLIGEHTDYNDGFVMPCALGFCTYVAISARRDRILNVFSIDFGENSAIDLDNPGKGLTGHWSDYVRGVAAVLRSRHVKLIGANLVIKGDVPIGAGLSSSAAIEVATALALLNISGTSLDRREIAAICQRAEHEYAGTKCGIMDQFIACFGEKDHALMLDCRSLDFELLPSPPQVRIVICNTMVKHQLASGEYNHRRADCHEGVRILQQTLPQIRALRDVDSSQLNLFASAMPERIFRRCRHVVTENARVLDSAEALRQNNLEHFGDLMYSSHTSLRDDYEVSCRELDLMVDAARQCAGVWGARMTGGGFGGCTVNLVQADAVTLFRSEVSRRYQAATGIQPEIYVCTPADGAGEVQLARA